MLAEYRSEVEKKIRFVTEEYVDDLEQGISYYDCPVDFAREVGGRDIKTEDIHELPNEITHSFKVNADNGVHEYKVDLKYGDGAITLGGVHIKINKAADLNVEFYVVDVSVRSNVIVYGLLDVLLKGLSNL